jgi:hypothetical protein
MVWFMIALLSKYDLADKVKQKKTGERCAQGRDGKSDGLEHFEDLGVDGNVILKNS